MHSVSGNKNVMWHECEVCHSYLVTYKNVNSKVTLQEIKIGKKTSVLVDNPDVAKILQKEQP